MFRWRSYLFVAWALTTLLALLCFLLPWSWFIPGYRFPYHGTPALVAGILSAIFGARGIWLNWTESRQRWPWWVAAGLAAVESIFIFAFFWGPDTAIATGESTGPWGNNPISIEIDIRPRWGAYAALITSMLSCLWACLSSMASQTNHPPGSNSNDPASPAIEK